ncbi:MAG: hypothetical protein Q7K44_04795 [Candidatus Liptonbacteria bacterium]|nr:hypothetical protein [Candidatus Liptonbacteria bacterium]
MNAKTETKTKMLAIQGTVDERSAGFNMDLFDDPLTFFIAYPTLSVRDACLEALNNGGVVRRNYPVSLVKWVVNGLIEACDDLWYSLLECFVSKTNESASDVVEFALKIAASGEYLHNGIVKMVVARLLGNSSDEIYWRTPSMEDFVRRLLEQPLIVSHQTKKEKYGPDYGYTDQAWTQLERGLKIITTFRDTSFIPLLDEIRAGMESGEIKPLGCFDEFRAADDLHFLRSRTSWLSKVAEDEKPDWHLLRSIAEEKAKLTGDVLVVFSCPKVISEGKATIKLSLAAANTNEQKKLNDWCKVTLKVAYYTEGFSGLRGASSLGPLPFEADGTWSVELMPTPGKNRLTIRIDDGREKGWALKASFYIRCVKEAPAESPNIIV